MGIDTGRILDGMRHIGNMVVEEPSLPGIVAAAGMATLAFPMLGAPLCVAAVAVARKSRAATRATVRVPRHVHGRGAHLLGTALRGGRAVWLDRDAMLRHVTVLGEAGRTRDAVLDNFAANAIVQGSGCLTVVADGNRDRVDRLAGLAERCGRGGDLLVLDFTEAPAGTSHRRRSNTMNPFATGGADVLTQMVVGMMDDAGDDGGMWKGRATAMFTGVMRALVFLRNSGLLDLDVGAIRDHLDLRKVIDFADGKKYADMPANIRKSVTSYLSSLPGFQPEKGYKQAQTTMDSHGFLEMQFTRILGSMADVYGHVFLTPHGEVDMFDVVLNRRILVVALPDIGKSKDEATNLARTVLASLRRMMGATLGSKVEDSWLDVVDKRMTTSPAPFVAILDDVAQYRTNHMGIMGHQARSLGISLVLAARDVHDMKALNDGKAPIIAETATRILTGIADTDTVRVALDMARVPYRPLTLRGVEPSPGPVAEGQVRMELLHRVCQGDVAGQGEGEMLVIQGDWVVRTKAMVCNPVMPNKPGKLTLRANHFVKIPKPTPAEVDNEPEEDRKGLSGDASLDDFDFELPPRPYRSRV